VNEPRQRHTPSRARRLAAAALLTLAAACAASAQTVLRGHISELRERRRVALLVSRTQTVDAREPARSALDGYRRALDGTPPRPHAAAHRGVARRVNKYIREYRSLTAVETVAEADFVIIFNVLRVRRSFVPDEPYVFGQLFVIARPTGNGAPPLIVWESEDNDGSLDDAVNDFLKALKDVRGER
jgi:hypothetical protein